jgi:hypothetical protein
VPGPVSYLVRIGFIKEADSDLKQDKGEAVMPEVALITVHGMGDTKRDYADALLGRVRSKLGPTLYGRVHTGSVYYQHILQANQQLVWQRVHEQARIHYDELRRFVLFGLGDAAGLENRKEDPGSVYELAQGEIARTLLAAHAANPEMPVVFLSQSLGCQVLSSYIYDAQKAGAGGRVHAGVWKNIDAWSSAALGRVLSASERDFLSAGTCMGWITTGCNIPVFVAAHKEMHIIPIAPPTPLFRWINIYDPDDVLGWPLRPLSAGYRELVEDRAINAGQGVVNWMLKSWNPLSHENYWSDDQVLEPLSAMLRRLAG